MNLEGKIRSFLILQPRDGDCARLVELFKDNDVLGKSIRYAGAYAAEVHVPVSGTGPVVVTAIWDSEEAYAGWRTHPIRDKMSPGMVQVVADTTNPLTITNGLYRIAVAATRNEA